jgi:hypothetical protein
MKFCIIVPYQPVTLSRTTDNPMVRAYNYRGDPAAPGNDLFTMQRLVRDWGYTEVPINSKTGREILARIK